MIDMIIVAGYLAGILAVFLSSVLCLHSWELAE